MGLKFTEAEGQAKKNKVEYLKLNDGINQFRMVGDILPRYVYWTKTADGNAVAVECLAFNRDTETFDNSTKDWFAEYFPDIKCRWAYCIQVIDRKDPGKLKVLGLKKKLLTQIKNAAEKLGDPTDLDNGWDIIVKRERTGPLPFNVEYTLQVFDLKNTPLTEEEKKMVMESKTIDELFPMPTPEEQKSFIEKFILNNNQEETPEVENEDVAF